LHPWTVSRIPKPYSPKKPVHTYQTSTSKTYAADNDATPTTTSISKRQLNNLPSGVTSRTISIDIHGNQTISWTTIDRDNKTVTQTTDTPDSTVDAVTVTVNGLLTSQKTAQNLTYTYTYDALGRRTGVTDPRTGTSTTAYFASGTGKTGKVQSQTNANGNTTTFDYDPATGRRIKVTNALGKDTIYTYNSRGQVTTVSGDATYPIAYVYDAYGAMSELHTFRDGSTPDITTSGILT
jgi:YD repeat-containing protein